MDPRKRLAALVEAMRAKIEERNTKSAQMAEIRDAEAPDEARHAALMGERDALDGDIDDMEASRAALVAEIAREDELSRINADLAAVVTEGPTRESRVGVGAEPRTYSARSALEGTSFFADMYRAEIRGDYHARERLARHGQEARVEGEMQARALATSGLAGLVPPQYLVDQYALTARAGRPVANIVTHEPLPDVGMNFKIPRGTTGVSVGVQASQNAAVSTTDEVWADVDVQVATIGGYAPVSRQSLDRAAVNTDSIIFQDLMNAYAVAVDQQVISGTGTSGQTTGILTTSGINQAAAFAAAATVASFYSALAGQINAVETSRYYAPDVIVMHPRRWNWLVAQLDSSTRPIVVPGANGPMNALGTFDTPQDTPSTTPVGTLLGLPVVTDASIPTSVGTGPEDQVLVLRRSDLILFESSSAPATFAFEQTAATTLTVTLVAYGYAAFTAGRYPSSVGVIGGNAATAGKGLIAPVF